MDDVRRLWISVINCGKFSLLARSFISPMRLSSSAAVVLLGNCLRPSKNRYASSNVCRNPRTNSCIPFATIQALRTSRRWSAVYAAASLYLIAFCGGAGDAESSAVSSEFKKKDTASLLSAAANCAGDLTA